MNFGTRRSIERLADDNGHFRMLAIDQRPPVLELIARQLGVDEAPLDAVRDAKRLLVDALSSRASAVLVDPVTAFSSSDLISPRQGMIMTLENSQFETRPDGRLTSLIPDWSVEKIKRIGADGVKFLAWYHPDAGPEVIAHQQQIVADVGAACRRNDIPFILELLLYPFPDNTPDAGYGGRRAQMVLESVETFADQRFGVDLFKLECPIPVDDLVDDQRSDASLQPAFDDLHRAAGRPWVLLSGGAPPDAFVRMLSLGYRAGASGYLAGRSIWWDALQHYPDVDRVRRELNGSSVDFMQKINSLTETDAIPFASSAEPRPPWDDVPSNYAGPLT
jgi:tagatose 1,6-diphosphate aldolase